MKMAMPKTVGCRRLPGQWVRGWSTHITFSAARQCSTHRCGWCKPYIARRGSSWKAGWDMMQLIFWHGPFEIYMSWVRNEVSSDLGRLVAGHVFEATGCQAPQISSRKATMMLQSHLCSPFLEAWHKNLWKNMVKAFSHIMDWQSLRCIAMGHINTATKRWHSDWGLDAEWQPNTSQGVALFQMAFRRSVLLGLWHMTVNTLKQLQDEVQKAKSDHSWREPLQLALVSNKMQ